MALGRGRGAGVGGVDSLVGKHLVRGPILAYHQHLKNLFLKLTHQENSLTTRCCLPPALNGMSATRLKVT